MQILILDSNSTAREVAEMLRATHIKRAVFVQKADRIAIRTTLDLAQASVILAVPPLIDLPVSDSPIQVSLKQNPLFFLSDDVKIALLGSELEAQRLKHKIIEREHILLGIIRFKDHRLSQKLRSMGVNLELTRAEIGRLRGLGSWCNCFSPTGLSPSVLQLLQLSLQEARRLGSNDVELEHLLLSLVKEESLATRVLKNLLNFSQLKVNIDAMFDGY